MNKVCVQVHVNELIRQQMCCHWNRSVRRLVLAWTVVWVLPWVWRLVLVYEL